MSRNHDINGKVSLKRYLAKILVFSGLFMAWFVMLIWGLAVLFKDAKVDELPTELIMFQLIAGLGAVGFTVAEKYTNNK